MVGQLFLVQSCVGSNPSTPETGEEKNEMLEKRVTQRKRGYQRKKPWIRVPYTRSHVRELRELRTEEGYLLGWEKEEKGVKVYLRYTVDGAPSRSSIQRRWKPSRERTVNARQRWGRNGERGRYVLQTSKGRRSSVEARKQKVGGIVWRWVS